MSSQVNLPSVCGYSTITIVQVSCCEVFNFMHRVQLTNKGVCTACYNSQDQAFSFHKQVRFKNGSSSPDLDHNPTPGPGPKVVRLLTVLCPTLNCMFDVSQISPFASGKHQDAATITAEVFSCCLWHKHPRNSAIFVNLK